MKLTDDQERRAMELHNEMLSDSFDRGAFPYYARELVYLRGEVSRLKSMLKHITELYETRSEVFTNDADLAATLRDWAALALKEPA